VAMYTSAFATMAINYITKRASYLITHLAAKATACNFIYLFIIVHFIPVFCF
jgi:hypothetical protein